MIDVIVTKGYEKAKMYYENQLAYKTTTFCVSKAGWGKPGLNACRGSIQMMVGQNHFF